MMHSAKGFFFSRSAKIISIIPAATLLSVTLWAQHETSSQKNPYAKNHKAIAEGKAIYNASCQGCHGAGGAGTGRGPALNVGSYKRAQEDGQLFDVIKNGIAGTAMPKMGLTVAESWKVVSYLRSLNKDDPDAAYGNAVNGEKLFSGKAGCMQCHQVNGAGGRIAPDLTTIGSSPATKLRQQILKPGFWPGYHSRLVTVKTKDGRTIRGLARNEDTFSIQIFDTDENIHAFLKTELSEIQFAEKSLMPNDYAERLSKQEIEDIVAYLRTLKKADPQKIAQMPINGVPDYERIVNSAKEPHNWLTYWGSYSGNNYSTLNQINTRNVSQLQTAWIQQTGEGLNETSPLVVDGIMYATGPGGRAWAMDAATGRTIWEYKYKLHSTKTPGGNMNRGMALLGGRLFLCTQDAYAVALDAKTGRQLWERKLAEVNEGYFSTTAPLALSDRILVGIGGGELGARGFLDALDPATGKQLWRFWMVPAPGEFGNDTWAGNSWKTGGGTTWLTGTYDPQLDLIYWPVGNPSPDLNGDARKGDNLFTCAVVAIEAKTGKRRWHFQFTPHDLYDWDATETPMLVDREWNGKMRKLLMQANRNAFFYVLDRETGEFLKGFQFARQNWAKGLDDKGRPILIPGMEPKLEGVKVYPNSAGATNWQSPSYNPETGLYYFTYSESGHIYYKEDQPYKAGEAWWGGRLTDPGEPTWGGIKAVDPATGETRWDYRFHVNIYQFAGCLATKGGVVFAANADGNFMAFEGKTGKLLWKTQTGGDIHAWPMTYSAKGRQYVAIASSGLLIAYALPETE
jgi:alcohol dehydrogenase (cytochrome c)